MATVKPQTTQQAVVAEVRRLILGGDYPPGAQILQDDLADRFQVSRVPVRDALRILEGEGLVQSEPHHGYRVAEIRIPELLEIQGMRQILETEALQRAHQYITDELVRAMAEALAEMDRFEEQGDLPSWVVAHRRFHFALFDAAQSTTLSRILGQLWNASDLYRSLYLQTESARASSRSQHRELLHAAEERNIAELLAVMDAHRATTVRALRTIEESE